jgi:RimJ/RimL family protein N-acetyltransferase
MSAASKPNRALSFSGKKIRLRPYDRADIDAILELINDESIKQYLMPGVALMFNRKDEENFIDSQSALSPERHSFAIERISDGAYLGGCGFVGIDWKSRHGKVGIFLGERFTGKGYGSEAMELLINFGFWEMNLNKIKLEVYSFNPRAIRVYEKLGFETEGVFKQELFRHGSYHDVISMALFRRDWENRTSG